MRSYFLESGESRSEKSGVDLRAYDNILEARDKSEAVPYDFFWNSRMIICFGK